MARKFFDHQQFNFEFQFALGHVHYGAGDLGEMLATADRIVDGDADSWCHEWIATGQRIAAIADECAKSGHEASARATYLRAAIYYAAALSAVDGTKDPDALLGPTFSEHRRCFDAYVALLDAPAERIKIPYEGQTMPGYLFRPSTSDSQRRTLIMNNGSDGPVTSGRPYRRAAWPADSIDSSPKGCRMRRQRSGTIVMVSSLSALVGLPVDGVYAASKFALEGFAESLAYEVRHWNVRVALANPGGYATGLARKSWRPDAAKAGDYRPLIEHLLSKGGGGGDPEDAAGAMRNCSFQSFEHDGYPVRVQGSCPRTVISNACCLFLSQVGAKRSEAGNRTLTMHGSYAGKSRYFAGALLAEPARVPVWPSTAPK